VLGTFHPTFLYELLWNVGVALLVIWADRRFKLSHGRAFALYVAAYCAGRLWIEMLRIDTAEHFLGVRLNVFTSAIVGLLAVGYLIAQRGRPREVITRGGDGAGTRGSRPRTAAGETPPSAPPSPEPRPAEDAVETAADGAGERRTTTPPDEGGRPPAG
jgi:hypothetical protein